MEREKLTVNVSEAAKAMGISRVSLYNVINRGEFRQVIRIGRRILIPKQALDNLLKNASGYAAKEESR